MRAKTERKVGILIAKPERKVGILRAKTERKVGILRKCGGMYGLVD